jgi:beta-lactamase superfamily II metal-dependent hydrolase
MPLDLYIHGPGFGEMILMRWKEGNKTRAAMVDVYCPTSKLERFLWWLKLKHIHRLAFMAITHPHLDHLLNADDILRAYKKRVDRLWVWPGPNQAAYIPYFNRQAATFRRRELKRRAKAISLLYEEQNRQFNQEHLGKPELTPFQQPNNIYPLGQSASQMEVACISPWDKPTTDFLKIITDGIDPKKGTITDTHRECNLVSGGFIIRYGQAQVLLGGDMETENWDALRAADQPPALNPCVVKVSHHGSSTGCPPDMWGENGFLGRHKPLTVITPWKKKLPERSVIDKIRASGCPVYLTGALKPSVDDGFPHIHLRVYQNSTVRVIHRSPSIKRLSGLNPANSKPAEC